jgi:hypothetical protein
MYRSAAPAWPRRLSGRPCRRVAHVPVIGGGTSFLPQVTEDVPLNLIETRTFGSRVIYERYRRVRDHSD